MSNARANADRQRSPRCASLASGLSGKSDMEDTELLLRPPGEKQYKELGSLEGVNRGVFRDHHGRSILHMIHRITGKMVKCILTGVALKKIQQHEIREVLRGRRIRVVGLIHYRGLGKINYVDASDINFPRTRRAELPTARDILDKNFTGGLRTEEYLERLRDGSLRAERKEWHGSIA